MQHAHAAVAHLSRMLHTAKGIRGAAPLAGAVSGTEGKGTGVWRKGGRQQLASDLALGLLILQPPSVPFPTGLLKAGDLSCEASAVLDSRADLMLPETSPSPGKVKAKRSGESAVQQAFGTPGTTPARESSTPTTAQKALKGARHSAVPGTLEIEMEMNKDLLMASRGEEVAFDAQAKESMEGGLKRDAKDAGAVEDESCGSHGGISTASSTASGSDGHLERHPERQPELVSSASDPLFSGLPVPVCERSHPLIGGLPQVATARVRRQSRERRVERWRLRLPLLDEDPREAELPHPPPGEASGEPAVLTPLGQRLVGLVPWI